MTRERVLVIGYGNPSRGDDGLGPALCARLAEAAPPGVTVEADYQLGVEHAYAAAGHDVVVFIDATASGDQAFWLRPLSAVPDRGFSSHSVSPGGVLHLARSCFGATPLGYLLGVRGYALEGFGEGLTEAARRNLEDAVHFLIEFLQLRDDT